MDQSCPECSSTFKTGENILQCFGFCKRSYHPKCVNISSRDYQVILNLKNLKWFCDICNHQSEICMDLLRQFNDFKISINTQLDDFKKSLDSKCSNTDLKLNEKTYADVAKDVVIIKPKTKQNNSITKDDICKNVKPASLEVGIVQMKNIKDGGIVIKCKNKEDSAKIKDAAEKKLKKKYSIKLPELVNPCLKVIGIDDDLEADELKACILKQNQIVQDEKSILNIKVLKKMKTKKMAIIETDPGTFAFIMNHGKLSIGWSICRVFEYVNIFRCYKCAGFGHMAKDCTEDVKCWKCAASDHAGEDCSSELWKCVNCVQANDSFKFNLSVNHSPFDSECPCLQRKINNVKRKINYDSTLI